MASFGTPPFLGAFARVMRPPSAGTSGEEDPVEDDERISAERP
jgi:hypothetical protein